MPCTVKRHEFGPRAIASFPATSSVMLYPIGAAIEVAGVARVRLSYMLYQSLSSSGTHYLEVGAAVTYSSDAFSWGAPTLQGTYSTSTGLIVQSTFTLTTSNKWAWVGLVCRRNASSSYTVETGLVAAELEVIYE